MPGNAFFDDTALHIHVPAGATPKVGAALHLQGGPQLEGPQLDPRLTPG